MFSLSLFSSFCFCVFYFSLHLLVEHGAKITSEIIRSAVWRASEPDGTFLPLKVLLELRVNLDTILNSETIFDGYRYFEKFEYDCLGYIISAAIPYYAKSKLQKLNQVLQFLLLNGSRVTLTKAYLQKDYRDEKKKAKEMKDMIIHWELIMLFFCLEKKNCNCIL